MRFIQQQGFSVKAGKVGAFQTWVTANEKRLRDAYPDGASLLGIYAAVFTSEKNAGNFYSLEQVDSYGALDTLAALAKDPASELAKVQAEFIPFLDLANYDAPGSKMLLKAVADATVFDDQA